MRVCIVYCSIELLQEHGFWTMINKYKGRILMCSFVLNRKIMEIITLLHLFLQETLIAEVKIITLS